MGTQVTGALGQYTVWVVRDRRDTPGTERLGVDDEVVLGLEELHQVVVRQRRQRQAMKSLAAVALAQLEVVVRWKDGAETPSARGIRLGRIGPLGVPAVRRVDDPRGPPVSHDLIAKLQPPLPGVSVRARQIASHRVLYRSRDHGLVAVDRPLLDRRRLLLGQIFLVRDLLRPLHRCDAAVVKDAPPRSGAPQGVRGGSAARPECAETVQDTSVRVATSVARLTIRFRFDMFVFFCHQVSSLR